MVAGSRKLFTPDEAREGLQLLKAQIEPTPTADLHLHAPVFDISVAVSHSTYDTLYLAFAVAMGASAVVAADGPFSTIYADAPGSSLVRDGAVAGCLGEAARSSSVGGAWGGPRAVQPTDFPWADICEPSL